MQSQPDHEDSFFFIEPSELQAKLSHLYATLQQQNEEVKKYYGTKIQELNLQIANKDRELGELRAGGVGGGCCKKCQALEWKVLEKDSIIEDLNSKIRNLQNLYRERLHQYIDKMDFSLCESSRKNGQSETSKRINISEYFIKAIETSKVSGKQDNVSTRIDGDTSEISGSDGLSLHNPMSNCLRNDSDPTGKVYTNGRTPLGKTKMDKVKSLNEQDFTKSRSKLKQKQQNPHRTEHPYHPSSPYSSTKKIQLLSQHTRNNTEHNHNQNQNHNMPSVQSKEERRLVLMEQRWKQISAFEQRRNNKG